VNEAIFDAVADQIEEADTARCRPQLFQETRSLRRMTVEATEVEGVDRVSASTATGMARSWMIAEFVSVRRQWSHATMFCVMSQLCLSS
jgi:hypothetical protein